MVHEYCLAKDNLLFINQRTFAKEAEK